MSNKLVNALTVDVEDYFQVSAFEQNIPRASWEEIPCRVEKNTDKILQIFSDHNVNATFFTLGWVADRYPALIKRIVDNGHEIASHGYSHIRVTEQKPADFREDIIRTKKLLEDLSGYPVTGYRAASYSINAENMWALDVLHDTGHLYSSSIYPVKHDLYGVPDAPRFPFRNKGDGILEIPISTVRLMNRNYPGGGGGFFRLFPYRVSNWLISRINNVDRKPAVFYFHPWELDPNQPKQKGITVKTRFRHYLNLGRMQSRLNRLLDDFKWDRMDKIFLKNVD